MLSRRKFVNWLLGTSAGAALAAMAYPVLRFLSPPDIPEASVHQIEAGPTNDPEFIEKGFKIIRFGAEPVIVIRVADSEFKAFAGTCTHLDCIVEYRTDKRLIWCNCHDGGYDLAGTNIIGPPPRPLEAFQVDLVDAGENRPQTVVVSKA